MCVHRESSAQRAVKVLRKSHMDDDEKRMLFNEINILKEIVSSNLLAIRVLAKSSLRGLWRFSTVATKKIIIRIIL